MQRLTHEQIFILMQNWAEDIIKHYCPNTIELSPCYDTPHITGEYSIDIDGDTILLSAKVNADDHNRIHHTDADLSFFKNHIAGYDHTITTGDIPFLVHFTVDFQ